MSIDTGGAIFSLTVRHPGSLQTIHFRSVNDLFEWAVERNLYECEELLKGLARAGHMTLALGRISRTWKDEKEGELQMKDFTGREVGEPSLDPPEPPSVAYIQHNGIEYTVDLDGDEPALVEYLRDYVESPYRIWYVYELYKAHHGPTILIEVSNPRMERDDDGWGLEYDAVRWADDKTPFDDDILTDCYWDVVREDIKELLCQI